MIDFDKLTAEENVIETGDITFSEETIQINSEDSEQSEEIKLGKMNVE